MSSNLYFHPSLPKAETNVTAYVYASDAYKAMYEAIKTATSSEHFICIAGWHLDIKMGLLINQYATSLAFLISQAKDITVRALLDLDSRGGSRQKENQEAVDFINSLPIGAALIDRQSLPLGSFHQKILIVSGSQGLHAFCGGIDIHPHRWNLGRCPLPIDRRRNLVTARAHERALE